MPTVDFEKKLVDVVCARLAETGMTHAEFGRLVFGDSDGGRLWRSVRDPKNTGKRRKVTVNEAYAMAKVLGVDLPSLIWQVAKESDL